MVVVVVVVQPFRFKVEIEAYLLTLAILVPGGFQASVVLENSAFTENAMCHVMAWRPMEWMDVAMCDLEKVNGDGDCGSTVNL